MHDPLSVVDLVHDELRQGLGWLGRIAGCNLGKPVENGDLWTPERIRSVIFGFDNSRIYELARRTTVIAREVG